MRAFASFAAGASLLLLTSAASADGYAVPRNATYQAPFSWTGFYVWGNVGYGWGGNTGGGYSSFQDIGIGGVAAFLPLAAMS